MSACCMRPPKIMAFRRGIGLKTTAFSGMMIGPQRRALLGPIIKNAARRRLGRWQACNGKEKKVKENKYDDPIFFEKYSEMGRSKYGLQGAGEWPELKKLFPNFSGKAVLDLGCGFGWHCQYAVEQGAAQVTGVDLSEKMLERARRTTSPSICYLQCPMEDISFPPHSFDLVLSSLAIHYVQDFMALVEKVKNCLKPEGDFIFSVEHPVFTAYGSQDWHYGPSGEILHFPVDNYYYEGQRQAIFLGEPVTKYHRTITTYLNGLLAAGFQLRAVVEPQPPESMMELPGMKDEMRRPMMLLVAARKK